VEFVELEKTDKSKKINNKNLKLFKKLFGGGYLGYKNVHHFGTVMYDPRVKLGHTIFGLESKLIYSLKDIPDDVVYSVLPFIRWKN
jgi:hypothetical protein